MESSFAIIAEPNRRTILNLLVAGCAPPKALTSVDLAYLHALYKVTATATFHGQRGEMIYQMEHSLGGQ